MTTNIGTLVVAAVRPNDNLDLYPVAICNEIQGGHHSYLTVAELYTIPTQRRQIGMLVTVTNDPQTEYNSTYVLQPNLITWAYLDGYFCINLYLENFSDNYINKLLISSDNTYKVNKVHLECEVGSCNVDTIVNIEPALAPAPLISFIYLQPNNLKVYPTPSIYLQPNDSKVYPLSTIYLQPTI